jgi:hypothetical protein
MPHTQSTALRAATRRLAHQARAVVDAYFRPPTLSPQVHIRVSAPPDPRDSVDGFLSPEPVIWSSDAESVTLQIRTRDPGTFPPPVLEGGLMLALTGYLQSLPADAFAFNFRRQILRTYPVTGSAVQIIRHLVHHLEEAVKRSLAVESCVAEGRARNLAPYFLHWVTPSPDGRRHYEHALPHAWMRALFLARLYVQFLPLTRLDGRASVSGLRSFWWDCHPWLLPEDRDLLDVLSAVVGRDSLASFASRVTASFEFLQRHLLGGTPVP